MNEIMINGGFSDSVSKWDWKFGDEMNGLRGLVKLQARRCLLMPQIRVMS
jgi:hypothetical protein